MRAIAAMARVVERVLGAGARANQLDPLAAILGRVGAAQQPTRARHDLERIRRVVVLVRGFGDQNLRAGNMTGKTGSNTTQPGNPLA